MQIGSLEIIQVFSIAICWSPARLRRFYQSCPTGKTGTCLPLPGIEPCQPRSGHHRSHPQRHPTFAKGYGGTWRTRNHHPFQTPQRLPRRLNRAAEDVWDVIKPAKRKKAHLEQSRCAFCFCWVHWNVALVSRNFLFFSCLTWAKVFAFRNIICYFNFWFFNAASLVYQSSSSSVLLQMHPIQY